MAGALGSGFRRNDAGKAAGVPPSQNLGLLMLRGISPNGGCSDRVQLYIQGSLIEVTGELSRRRVSPRVSDDASARGSSLKTVQQRIRLSPINDVGV